MERIDRARRTYVVRPNIVDVVRLLAERNGIAGLVKVVADESVPADAFYVIDTDAFEAAQRDAMHRIIRRGAQSVRQDQ